MRPSIEYAKVWAKKRDATADSQILPGRKNLGTGAAYFDGLGHLKRDDSKGFTFASTRASGMASPRRVVMGTTPAQTGMA
jgi:hypothetical protein